MALKRGNPAAGNRRGGERARRIARPARSKKGGAPIRRARSLRAREAILIASTYFEHPGKLLAFVLIRPGGGNMSGSNANEDGAHDARRAFENGVAIAWHRIPWMLGGNSNWSEEGGAAHYDDLCALDGRIVIAGEHASRIPGWQEGAVTSVTDAITRLHAKVMSA